MAVMICLVFKLYRICNFYLVLVYFACDIVMKQAYIQVQVYKYTCIIKSESLFVQITLRDRKMCLVVLRLTMNM